MEVDFDQCGFSSHRLSSKLAYSSTSRGHGAGWLRWGGSKEAELERAGSSQFKPVSGQFEPVRASLSVSDPAPLPLW